jgi:hypothetical protein
MKTGAFVLGYHGCTEEVGEKLLAGEPFRPSTHDWEWLGAGIYFWENNPRRALEWVKSEKPGKEGSPLKPFAVGAVINLGLCLDLTESLSLREVKTSFQALKEINRRASEMSGVEVEMPRNVGSHKGDEDRTIRKLDCAVINLLHEFRKFAGRPAYDTVRGAFIEGRELYPGAMIREKTHIQIAVVNPECIHGVFRIRPELLAEG